MRSTAHVGSRSFEIGNNDLEAESAFSLDPSMHIRADRFDATAAIFSNHFSSNICLRKTEQVEDGFAVFRSSQGAAIFRGFEAVAEFELFHCPTHHLALHLWRDHTIAALSDGDRALPRIPPLRTGADMSYELGSLFARASFK